MITRIIRKCVFEQCKPLMESVVPTRKHEQKKERLFFCGSVTISTKKMLCIWIVQNRMSFIREQFSGNNFYVFHYFSQS